MLALELNDVELLLATSGSGEDGIEVLAWEPACVSIDAQGEALTGLAALARSRLQPLQTYSRHWQELDATPLGRRHFGNLSTADLAFEQLQRLLAAQQERGMNRLLITLPAGYSPAQLGLLLGIAREAGAGEIGLVDHALAACALQPVPPHVVHLDIYQHRAIATAIEQSGEGLGARRAQFEIDAGSGIARIEQSWIEMIAGEFVRRTRFDPLHQAATEQQLADGLRQWRAVVADGEQVDILLTPGGQEMRVSLPRAQWIAAAEPHYAALLQLVQRARPAGRDIELRVGAGLAQMPGLRERLESLPGCHVVVLPAAAAARGALQHHTHILRGEQAALVNQLPLTQADGGIAARGARQAGSPATHLLHAGRATALSSQPLLIGSELPPGASGIAVPRGLPGVSRVHCRVSLADGVASVEDCSTYGTFVNEARVHGRVALARGDRLRIGSPGVTFDLIEVVN